MGLTGAGRCPTRPDANRPYRRIKEKIHMTVLDRSELQASPLADLHLIADQIGLEGFRRLRKADLIDAILGEKSPAAEGDSDASEGDRDGDGETPERRPRARRSSRSRRVSSVRKSVE